MKMLVTVFDMMGTAHPKFTRPTNQLYLLRRNTDEVREAVRTTTPAIIAQAIAHYRAYCSKLILLLDWNTPLTHLIFLPMPSTVFKQ
jgi:hypothetical protein